MKRLMSGCAIAFLFALVVSLAMRGQPTQTLAPIDFEWFVQVANPFPPGVVPGFPSVPPEFEKAGVLVSIKNCEGCELFRVRVTYQVMGLGGFLLLHPVAETIVTRMVNPNGDRTYAVLWLGKTLADHRVVKVEVEALAVVAKSEQGPK